MSAAVEHMTPDRGVAAFYARPSPQRSPSVASPNPNLFGPPVHTAGAPVGKYRDKLRAICNALKCSACHIPADPFLCDGEDIYCESCAPDDAIVLPSAIAKAVADVRELFADINAAVEQSQPMVRTKVRAKVPAAATPDRPVGDATAVSPSYASTFSGQHLNPNLHNTPSKSLPSSAASSDGAIGGAGSSVSASLYIAAMEGLSVTETNERDLVRRTEAEERITLQKDHAAGMRKAKAAQRDSTRQLKSLGDTKYEEASYPAAIDLYSAALRSNDGTAPLSAIYGNRSAAFFMLHAWAECIDDCEKGAACDDIKQPQSRTKLLVRGAKASSMVGDFEKAAAFLSGIPDGQRTVENERDFSRYLAAADQLATLVTKTTAEKIEVLRMLIADTPEATPIRLQLANLYIASGEFNRASTLLDLVAVSTPAMVVTKARSFYMQGFERVPEAIALLRTMADQHPEAAAELARVEAMELGKQRGNSLFSANQYAESIQQYTDALTHADDVPNIRKILYCNRAASFKELKKYREGVDDCTNAISIDPTFAKAYTRRARCLLALECFDGATRDFNKAMRLSSSPEEARNLEAELRAVERAERAVKDREKDYYVVLEVAQTATEKEIKKAYKLLSLKWHPDKNVHLSDDEKKVAEHKFKLISEAHSTLTDEIKKREYDLKRRVGTGAGGRFPMDPSDFRGAYYEPPRGAPAGTRFNNNPPPAWQRQPGKYF
jgi:tetratricopeptide (TPR) repeat protein